MGKALDKFFQSSPLSFDGTNCLYCDIYQDRDELNIMIDDGIELSDNYDLGDFRVLMKGTIHYSNCIWYQAIEEYSEEQLELKIGNKTIVCQIRL